MSDEHYMRLALRLARRGLGKTSPNPMVGAVIVKNSRVIDKGYHHYFGGKHAEVDAFENAGDDIVGATLYVTLEPCCHQGKTPPCVDAIIRHRIRRVVIGTLDPNPLVGGRSVDILRRQGIETTVGILEEECRALNEAYFKYMTTGLPLVTVKFAQTLDGRIAAATGSSQWISSLESRRLAHRMRAVNDAVMVGVGTVIADDPDLTVRLVRGRNPLKVVLDSGLRIPPQAKVLSNLEKAPTLIAATRRAGEEKLLDLWDRGIEVMMVGEDEHGEVELHWLLEGLGKRGISSLLVEGGARTITSVLRLRLADRLVVITAPKIMGRGIEAVGELGTREVDKAVKLSFRRTYRLGEDLVIEAKVG